MAKPLTPEQKERIKDKRLQSKYGITLARQNEMRAEQENRCKICRAEFTSDNPPCTDHFHFRVRAEKFGFKNWGATGELEIQRVSVAWRPSKKAAIQNIRETLAPRAVRGLLCRKCNRGLGYIERFFDGARHPENLLSVIEYFQARLKKS